MARRVNPIASPNQAGQARIGRQAAAAALLACLVYLNALSGAFLGEEVQEIRDNPRVHSLGNIPSLWTGDFWGSDGARGPLYRPMVATSSTLLHALGGGRPFVFHGWSLLIHALASALAVVLIADLGFGGFVAIAAGLLFAVHPVHTEAVAWISGQSELLASVFILLAWIAHVRRRWIPAAVCLAAALFSKETAVIFPLLAICGDLLGPRAGPRGAGWPARIPVRPIAAYAGVVGIYLVVRYLVLGHVLESGDDQIVSREIFNPLVGQPAAVRFLTAVKVMGKALGLSLAPVRLCMEYGYNEIPVATGFLDPGVLAAIALAGAGGLAGWLLPAARRPILLGFLIFFTAFLPTSNFLIPGLCLFAERYLYLPLLGICLAAAVLVSRLRWKWGLAVALAALLGGRTVARNPEFADPARMIRASADSCPQSAMARYALGVQLRSEGRLDESEAAHRKALEIAPHFTEVHGELGLTLLLAGKLDEADRELSEAVRLHPDDWRARANRARLLDDRGRTDEAIREYALLMQGGDPGPDLQGNYAAALIRAGRVPEARRLLEKLRDDQPASAVGPNGLGALAFQEGDFPLAARLFEEAVRRDPENVNAIFNHAQALVLTGRTREAVESLERAVAAGVADAQMKAWLDSLRQRR